MSLSHKAASFLHRHPQIYRLAKRTVELRGFLPPVPVEGLPGRVHRNDLMALDREAYRSSSKAHFQALSEDLAEAGQPWDQMGAFIDFGCGYGRVTRWLPSVLPKSAITACDVNREAVRWCEKEFGVNGLTVKGDLSATQLGHYDGLFACSVLTHLSSRRVQEFLHLVPRILNPGGVAVFTGKSEQTAQNVSHINPHLEPDAVSRALAEEGFFFEAYPHYRDPDLGDTYFTRAWLAAQLPETLELFGWKPGRFWSHDSYIVRRKAG